MSRENGVSMVEGFPFRKDVRIVLHHESGLVVMDKPVGVRAHPNTAERDPRALLTCEYDPESESYSLPGGESHPSSFFLINRLDAPTSGVILGAFEEETARVVREQFAARRVEKTYEAIVFSEGIGRQKVWRDRLREDRRGGGLRVRKGGGQSAFCTVRELGIARGRFAFTRIELSPETGRSHQLRVQCAEREVPIVGDKTYGDFRRNREVFRQTGLKRLFLHARRIACEFNWRGKTVKIDAVSDIPTEFDELVGMNRRRQHQPTGI